MCGGCENPEYLEGALLDCKESFNLYLFCGGGGGVVGWWDGHGQSDSKARLVAYVFDTPKSRVNLQFLYILVALPSPAHFSIKQRKPSSILC